MSLHDLTLTELSRGLDNGDYSSLSLTEALLERIAALDADLNAFITVTADAALDAARKADAERADATARRLGYSDEQLAAAPEGAEKCATRASSAAIRH